MTRCYFTDEDAEGYPFVGQDIMGDEIPYEEPMRCHDCGRPCYYDYEDDNYHHAVDAEVGCFLIAPEDRPDDPNHPDVGR